MQNQLYSYIHCLHLSQLKIYHQLPNCCYKKGAVFTCSHVQDSVIVLAVTSWHRWRFSCSQYIAQLQRCEWDLCALCWKECQLYWEGMGGKQCFLLVCQPYKFYILIRMLVTSHSHSSSGHVLCLPHLKLSDSGVYICKGKQCGHLNYMTFDHEMHLLCYLWMLSHLAGDCASSNGNTYSFPHTGLL